MAHNLFLFFCLISLAAAAIQVSYAVTYTVTNTPLNTLGGSRFNSSIGEDYTEQIMETSTNFIWAIFKENDPIDRKSFDQVDLVIDDVDGVAYTFGTQIQLSASYIEDYIGDVKNEITGVIYHEMTHVWQWNANGNANKGLIDGIADYIRLEAGHAPGHWVKPGQGDRWDQGYDVTARFLHYCDSLRGGFVADLNKMMIFDYEDDYFFNLLGKSVDQLWDEYKALYNDAYAPSVQSSRYIAPTD